MAVAEQLNDPIELAGGLALLRCARAAEQAAVAVAGDGSMSPAARSPRAGPSLPETLRAASPQTAAKEAPTGPRGLTM